jgi:gas vesicle protein
MKGKTVLVVGAAAAYLFGTESGRRNLEKAKAWARTTWENPTVQKTVQDVESRVTQVVKEQGSALSEKVTAAVKDAMAGAQAKAAPQAPADPDEIVVEEDGSVRTPTA